MKFKDINEVMEVLWNSVDSMRGLINTDDSKNYILGMLVLKKISEHPNSKVLNWSTLEASAFNIGQMLNEAFDRYEQTSPSIKGWFKGLDFDSNHIGSRNVRDNLWKTVVSILSQVNLTSIEGNNPGSLCDLDLELNERFSIEGGRKGSFETPKCVISLLSKLLFVTKGSTFYDPFCSSGTTLIWPACFLKKTNEDIRIDIFGQTPNPQNLLTLYLNLALTDNLNANIAEGDVIRNPGFINGRRLKTFQKILSTIPIGVKNWGEEIAQYDTYSRFWYGVPPRTQGEYGYLQHCIASLTDDGMLAVIIPPSMLFRERSEGDIRKRIINDDIIEAVISLPNKLFAQTSISFAILVINRKKAKEHKGKILFINAKNDYLRGRSQNTLRNEDQDKIVFAFKEFRDIEGFCRVCSLDEIAQNNFQLDVSQYIKESKSFVPKLNLDDAIRELDSIHTEKNAVYYEMHESLRKIMELQGGN